MENIFKIKYTAQELESLLDSIGSKLTKDDITNEFTDDSSKISSARLAFILNEKFTSLSDPTTFMGLYKNIQNAEIFTTTEKEKLSSLDLASFKGVFSNASTRNAALPSGITNAYNGKEITFLLDNGLGQQSWDYWDNITHLWVASKVAASGTVDSLNVPAVGTVVYTSMDKTKFQTCKMTIQATKTTSYQSMEILIGTNGTDTYLTAYGEIGNDQLFEVTTSISGDFVDVSVTTLSSNVTLKARKTAEI